MFDIPDCVDKCLHWPGRFALTGSHKLVTQLSTYTSCTLYCSLTTFYSDTELLPSDSMLLRIICATGFTHCFKCAYWAFHSAAAIATSRWTNWCLRCSSVSARGALQEAAIVQLDSDCTTTLLRWLWSHGLLLRKRFRRWKRKVESPEEYIGSYRSDRNEWLPTCTVHSRCILVRGDSNGPVIYSKSVKWCLFVNLQGYIDVNTSWYLVFDRYGKEILRRKGRLVMFVPTHSRDLTWTIH